MDNSSETTAGRTRRGIPNRVRAYGTPGAAAVGEEEGDEGMSADALEAAIDAWGDTVLRLATSRLGSQADAEDAFQTVFLRLFQSNPRFRDDEHLKAWLLRVTVNCCNDVHRSPWCKRRSAFDAAVAATLEAPAEHGEQGDRGSEGLERALGQLTDGQRTAVHLFYFEGYDTEEIAQITGERPATVRSHLHRARKTLRAELGAKL